MKIILHNPSHNGDQLHTLAIVKKIIDDNLDKEFIICPACSSYLFIELLSERVVLEEHPVIWDNTRNIFNNKNFISEHHNVLWNYHNGNIYINIWKLLTQNNHNCISLISRPEFIRHLLNEITYKTGIKLIFNCNNYTDLIPVMPHVSIDVIREKINSYNKKVIFFYNQNSFCGVESTYPTDMNEKTIQYLINHYSDYLIILSKPCNIIHPNLINVETEFSNVPSLDGKNLVINANIANICNIVFFKNNGGSFFILSKLNISNSKNVQYCFIGKREDYNVISNEYGLNVKFVPI